eukprot:m.330416 g.330416  ORF g.330416 m.330416 type:complete len:106 (-) comp27719_c0_seq25:2217-2534(-)
MDAITEGRMFGSRFSPEVPIRAMQGIQEAVLLKQLARFPLVKVLYGHEFSASRSALDKAGLTMVLTDVKVLVEENGSERDVGAPEEILKIRSKVRSNNNNKHRSW